MSKINNKKDNFYKYVKSHLFKRLNVHFNVVLGLVLPGNNQVATKIINELGHDLDVSVKAFYFADYENSMDLCAKVADSLLKEEVVFIMVDTLTDTYFKNFLQLFKQENELYDSLVDDYSLSSHKLSSDTHLFIAGLEGDDGSFLKNELVALTDVFFDAREMEL